MTKSTIAGCALAIAFIRCEAVEVEKTLCSMDSVILFNCETAKNKVISLCAVKSFKRATVEYRYGTPRKIDFRIFLHLIQETSFIVENFKAGVSRLILCGSDPGLLLIACFHPTQGQMGSQSLSLKN
jgi:hypothetical protein